MREPLLLTRARGALRFRGLSSGSHMYWYGQGQEGRGWGAPVPWPAGAMALASGSGKADGAGWAVMSGIAEIRRIVYIIGPRAQRGAAAEAMHGMEPQVPMGVANGMAEMSGMAEVRGIPAAGAGDGGFDGVFEGSFDRVF